MSEQYGVTPTGVVIKRLDVILDEIHGDLSEQWGFNTRQNPQSFLNVLVTDFADKVAELWEYGKDIYDAMYPFSAEGLSLDNAVQFGGISRNEAYPTIYPIHCECVDGTVLPEGALIKSSTNPETLFSAVSEKKVTRNEFNRAKVRVSAIANDNYSLALNGRLFFYTSGSGDTAIDIINGLAAAISDEDFTVEADGAILNIQAVKIASINTLVLSGNLTTETVTGIANFQSQEFGEVVFPSGTINAIVTVIPGLIAVNNLSGYIRGNLRESDIELRKSYVDKIFHRSTTMRDSIRSAILQDVQGVTSCVVYENDTAETDEMGRYPHSVEVVVDGGSDLAIAQVIFEKKAAGINTYGSSEINLTVNGDTVTVRFNRPQRVFVWFRVEVTINPSVPLPANYVDMIRESIKRQMSTLESGINVVQQKYNGDIYATVPGIGYIEIPVWYTVDPDASPAYFTDRYITLTARQKAVTDDTRIEVVLVD
jgi:uncharacterized phage protein gp47/JayE